MKPKHDYPHHMQMKTPIWDYMRKMEEDERRKEDRELMASVIVFLLFTLGFAAWIILSWVM